MADDSRLYQDLEIIGQDDPEAYERLKAMVRPGHPFTEAEKQLYTKRLFSYTFSDSADDRYQGKTRLSGAMLQAEVCGQACAIACNACSLCTGCRMRAANQTGSPTHSLM